MALPDISNLLVFMPELLRELPFIIQAVEIITYIFLILLFGSIIVKGYRGYMHSAARFLLRIGTGSVSLISGISLSGFLPFFNTSIYKILHIDMIIGGLIAVAVLTFCIYLISHHIFNIEGIRKQIRRLQDKLRLAEEIRSRGRAGLDPFRVAGIVILAIFLIFSFGTFRGFPDILSEMGLSKEDLNKLADEIEIVSEQFSGANLPRGCISIAVLANEYGFDLLKTPYTDPDIKSMIEQESGYEVLSMFTVTYNQQNIILAVTQEEICSATQTQFCECINV